MNTDPAALKQLLALQKIDTESMQIAHKIANLPAAKVRNDAEKKLSELQDELVLVRVAAADMQSKLNASEGEVSKVRQRAELQQQRMNAAGVSAKEVQAISHELQALHRFQRELEDQELADMEEMETAAKRVQVRTDQVTAAEAELSQAIAQQEQEQAVLADQQKDIADRIESARDDLPADLLEHYDDLKQDLGIAVAAYVGGRCSGCGLELTVAENARLKTIPDEEVAHCSECGRILVRGV